MLLVDERPEGVAFVAVIDGATDKVREELGRQDRRAARSRDDREHDPGVPGDHRSTFAAVTELTRAVAELRVTLGIEKNSSVPPTASVAILSAHRRELWRVGDLHLGVRYAAGDLPVPG